MKKALFGNLPLKIISIVLAMLMWVYVTYRGQSEMAFDVPISFKNVPRGLELLRASSKTASVNLRGHERLLKSLRSADISVVVDLSNGKRGESAYYLDKTAVVVPGTLDILRVEPTSVKVVLDEAQVKTLPVRASIVGSPEQGFRIASVEINPSSVTVQGARSELARIGVLRTEAIDVSGLDSDIRETARLNISGQNIRTTTPEVTVSIAIRRK